MFSLFLLAARRPRSPPLLRFEQPSSYPLRQLLCLLTSCRQPSGRLFTAAEREVVSPLMSELLTRADALTASTRANLQSFVPQVCGSVLQVM